MENNQQEAFTMAKHVRVTVCGVAGSGRNSVSAMVALFLESLGVKTKWGGRDQFVEALAESGSIAALNEHVLEPVREQVVRMGKEGLEVEVVTQQVQREGVGSAESMELPGKERILVLLSVLASGIRSQTRPDSLCREVQRIKELVLEAPLAAPEQPAQPRPLMQQVGLELAEVDMLLCRPDRAEAGRRLSKLQAGLGYAILSLPRAYVDACRLKDEVRSVESLPVCRAHLVEARAALPTGDLMALDPGISEVEAKLLKLASSAELRLTISGKAMQYAPPGILYQLVQALAKAEGVQLPPPSLQAALDAVGLGAGSSQEAQAFLDRGPIGAEQHAQQAGAGRLTWIEALLKSMVAFVAEHTVFRLELERLKGVLASPKTVASESEGKAWVLLCAMQLEIVPNPTGEQVGRLLDQVKEISKLLLGREIAIPGK